MKKLILLLLLIGVNAWAGGGHHKGEKGDTGEQGIQGVAGTNGSDGVNGSQGIKGAAGTNGLDGTAGSNGLNSTNYGAASAIAASQHQFYMGTTSWQGSVGVGAIGGKSAISLGLAKRWNNKVLLNGSVSNEAGRFSGGLGVNFQFD